MTIVKFQRGITPKMLDKSYGSCNLQIREFHENILNSFQVIEQTRCVTETDRQTTEAKTVCLHPSGGDIITKLWTGQRIVYAERTAEHL